MAEIIVRKATSADLDTLLHFEQQIVSTERPFDSTLKSGLISYYDLKSMLTAPDAEVAVAELDHTIIGSGFARIETAKPFLAHQQHAWLGFMYVDSAHRGKGVNQKIIEYLKQWAAAHNLAELRLDVYVDNAPAIKAYEKAGFTRHLVEMRLGI